MSSDSPPSSRRWSRLRHLLSARRRRSPPAPTPTQPAYPQSDLVRLRRSRRNRHRRLSPHQTPNQSYSSPLLPTSVIHPHSLPVQSLDDTSDDSSAASPSLDHHPHPHPSSTSHPLTDLDAIQEHDFFAVFDRIFDDFDNPNTRPDYQPPTFYLGRIPPNASRHSVAIRLPNALYITNRRQVRHSQLTTELEREFRLNMRALRGDPNSNSPSAYDCSASDAQIGALPTFVMEKGETRSVKQIFASMKHPSSDAIGECVDECGGLMTSYTECAICLSDFEPGDEITSLPCGHFFHLTGCVREWLRNHARTCPTCRADISVTAGSSRGPLSSSAGISATAVSH